MDTKIQSFKSSAVLPMKTYRTTCHSNYTLPSTSAETRQCWSCLLPTPLSWNWCTNNYSISISVGKKLKQNKNASSFLQRMWPLWVGYQNTIAGGAGGEQARTRWSRTLMRVSEGRSPSPGQYLPRTGWSVSPRAYYAPFLTLRF